MKDINLEDIRIASARTSPLEVEEWGGLVYIKEMTIDQRLNFELKYMDKEGKLKNINDLEMIYDMIALCVVDKESCPLFSSTEGIDVMKKSTSTVMQKLFLKALRANYFSVDSVDKLKKK